MNYSFLDFLQLLGALGIFIYGMKIMSESIQRIAGENLRKIMKYMTSNRALGILTGFAATALVQSSSATTVMIVSFVNAGLLKLPEAIGVIMGANIGTTVTAWLISLLGFKVKITSVAIVLIGIGFPLLFAKREKLRYTAEAIIGFGILFIGLEFLKDSVPDLKENPEIFAFFNRFIDLGFLSTLLFVLVGTLLTIVVQSSSASMALTLVMLAEGWITFPIAAAIVLGENIGTTITANLAALVANIHAKRAARFHLLFNIIGVTWMLIVMQPFLMGIDWVLGLIDAEHVSVFADTVEARQEATIALSLFHSAFNILNVLLLVAFVPVLERLVVWFLPSKGTEDEEFRLQYISTGLLATPEMSLTEAKKEIQLFAKLIEKMSFSFMALLFEKGKDPQKIIDKIKKREEITDNMELEIAQYLTQVSESDLSKAASEQVRGMLRMINDLERIGDIYFQMTKNFERMKERNITLPEDAKQELNDILDLIYQAVKLMRYNLSADPDDIDLNTSFQLESKINQKRNEIRDNHFIRLEKGIYDVQAGVIFLDYVNRAEKIGDHIINVNEALFGFK